MCTRAGRPWWAWSIDPILIARGAGFPWKSRNNPMQSRSSTLPMHQSPRCGAKTRKATLCHAPAMPNGRCRMHGGRSMGAPKGNQNALKHGLYAAEALAQRGEVAELLRAMRKTTREVDQLCGFSRPYLIFFDGAGRGFHAQGSSLATFLPITKPRHSQSAWPPRTPVQAGSSKPLAWDWG